MLNTSEVIVRNLDQLSGNVLLLGLADADLPPALEGHSLTVMTEHAGSYQSLRARLGENVHFGYPATEMPGRFECVVVLMPKSKAELQMRLAYAMAVLAEQGKVLLVGEKKEGIAGGASLLATRFAETFKLDTARHCHLWSAQRPVASERFVLDDWIESWRCEVAGTELEVFSLPGVFSHGRLDEATRLLLETFTHAPRGPLLDFACGAGIIGTWLGKRWPNLSLDLLDVQSQAMEATRRTLAANGVKATPVASDGLVGCTRRYATIVSNPPFHDGVRSDMQITQRFLQAAARQLGPEGELRLVANNFLPYQEWIEATIGPCVILAENRRFRVYQARRSAK